MKTEIFGGVGLRIYGQILIHARGLMNKKRLETRDARVSTRLATQLTNKY